MLSCFLLPIAYDVIANSVADYTIDGLSGRPLCQLSLCPCQLTIGPPPPAKLLWICFWQNVLKIFYSLPIDNWSSTRKTFVDFFWQNVQRYLNTCQLAIGPPPAKLKMFLR